MGKLSTNHLASFVKQWNSVPIVKRVPHSVFERIVKPIQRNILEILLHGRQISTNGPNMQYRYALSANEIRKSLKNQYETPISYQNVYFYLNQLESLEVIMAVGQVSTGKRTTTYYMRTAKVFISEEEDEVGYLTLVRDEAFTELLTGMDISPLDIDRIQQSINRINRPNFHAFERWVNSHTDILNQVPVDFRRLMELFYLIQNLDNEVLDTLKELGTILDMKNVQN